MQRPISSLLVFSALAQTGCGPNAGGGDGSGEGDSSGSAADSSTSENSASESTGPNVCADGRPGDEGYCFSEPVSMPTGLESVLLVVGDVDAEGGDDVYAFQWTPVLDKQSLTLFGDAELGLVLGPSGAVTQDAGSPVLADIDGQSPDDLLWSDGAEVQTAIGDGSGVYTPTLSSPIEQADPSTIAPVDWNGDGRTDLVVATHSPGGFARLEPTVVGEFDVVAFADVGSNSWGPFGTAGIAAAQFGGGPELDIAIVVDMTCDLASARELRVYLDGTLDFVALELPFTGLGSRFVFRAGDLDGDGVHEAITGTEQQTWVYGLEGSEIVVRHEAPASRTIAVGDLDGDGKSDLVLGDETRVRLLADWSDAPAREDTIEMGGNVHTVAIGDFNGDSLADIVAHDAFEGRLLALFSNP